MIEIASLTEFSVGREVRYKSYNQTEFGHITSWNEKFIFVRYHTRISDRSLKKIALTGATSQATDPKDLEFTR